MFLSQSKPIRVLISLALLCSLATRVLCQERTQTAQPKGDENRQTSAYELVTKGVVGSSVLRVQFKTAPLRLEIRNLVMGRGETEAIPIPTRILLEVRQGAVTTTINQEQQGRSQGDFWVVDKGSSFTMQNSGEVAVIRAIYIFEGSR